MKNMFLVIKIFLLMIAIFIISNIGLYVYAYITPKFDLNTANNIYIYDKNDNLVFENLDGSKWVKLKDISDNIKNATISVEDKHFYNHMGFDYLRIFKVLVTNFLSNSKKQGASTISQQYIKNLYLDFDKTWARKIEEAYLTFELEVHYEKDEILEGYLNSINYGGVYGIEAACEYYFNKDASEITMAEATILVGIPKNPVQYNPITNLDKAKKRQKTVLNSMVKNNILTKEAADNIYNEELTFYGEKDSETLESLSYYKDAVLSELKSLRSIPLSLFDTKGLKIYTNLDISVQENLEKIVEEEMNDEEDLQVASIVIEPKSGKVLALLGGKDYSSSQFNRVTQSKRPVGSTIKPFLYYAALENGFNSSSTFTSEETTFNIGNNKTYSPNNYGKIYGNKAISLAAAIAYSDNIYAVKTHLFLGEQLLVDTAKRVGITTELNPNPSLALGTNEISMLDYSNGFITLANEGVKNKSYLIRKITDIDDKNLYSFRYSEETVLNSRYLYVLNEMLSNTYSYSFVDYTSPTMLSIGNLLTGKYSIKSGSTSNDYWTVGYNPDMLVMTWCGYDDNRNVQSNQSKISKRIWAKTIEVALTDKEKTWYEIPNGVTASIVNPISGEFENKGNSVLLYYIKGTEPLINKDLIVSKEEKK